MATPDHQNAMNHYDSCGICGEGQLCDEGERIRDGVREVPAITEDPNPGSSITGKNRAAVARAAAKAASTKPDSVAERGGAVDLHPELMMPMAWQRDELPGVSHRLHREVVAHHAERAEAAERQRDELLADLRQMQSVYSYRADLAEKLHGNAGLNRRERNELAGEARAYGLVANEINAAIAKANGLQPEPYPPFEGTDVMDGDEDRP
jgi:hypothetical protein